MAELSLFDAPGLVEVPLEDGVLVLVVASTSGLTESRLHKLDEQQVTESQESVTPYSTRASLLLTLSCVQ